jgi:hypothetical protein
MSHKHRLTICALSKIVNQIRCKNRILWFCEECPDFWRKKDGQSTQASLNFIQLLITLSMQTLTAAGTVLISLNCNRTRSFWMVLYRTVPNAELKSHFFSTNISSKFTMHFQTRHLHRGQFEVPKFPLQNCFNIFFLSSFTSFYPSNDSFMTCNFATSFIMHIILKLINLLTKSN